VNLAEAVWRFNVAATHVLLHARRVRGVDNGSGGLLFLDTNELEARHRPRYLVYLVPADMPIGEEVPVMGVPISMSVLVRDVDLALDVLATAIVDFERLLDQPKEGS
jgi:hypothetical protein